MMRKSDFLTLYLLKGVFEKIDVAVNAPEPGTITEFLAKEEDTVTVGQDLVKMELGGAPAGAKKEQGGQEPKEPASDKQSTSSYAEPEKDESKKAEAPPPAPKREPMQESKASAPSPPTSKAQESKKPDSGPKSTDVARSGSREERKVCWNPALLVRESDEVCRSR